MISDKIVFFFVGLRHQTPVTESSKSPIAERTVTASTIQGTSLPLNLYTQSSEWTIFHTSGETPERGDPLHQRSSTTAEQGMCSDCLYYYV